MMDSQINLKKTMTRPTIIAGNWKMHKTIGETEQFIRSLKNGLGSTNRMAYLAPPFTAIASAALEAKNSPIKIGAQNMSDAAEGAFTGEISARMLKEAGTEFVILGHSERRSHFFETDEHINHKLKRACLENLPVILCIGETQEERDAGRSLDVLHHQIQKAFEGLSQDDLHSLIIAYEPVWAIGTGKIATPELAGETHNALRAHLANCYNQSFADRTPILYGGSVKPSNIESILEQPDIDGALIGGASLDVKSFTQMVCP